MTAVTLAGHVRRWRGRTEPRPREPGHKENR